MSSLFKTLRILAIIGLFVMPGCRASCDVDPNKLKSSTPQPMQFVFNR